MIKEGKELAHETYGSLTDEEMLRRLGELENQLFITTEYETRVRQYVAERLGCSVDEATRIIKTEAVRAKQREEAAKYEKEKNMRECRGLPGSSFFQDEWTLITEVYASRNTPSFLIDAALAASAAASAYRCGFCHELGDEELILKKRCKSCKRSHMCCNHCISATSCSEA